MAIYQVKVSGRIVDQEAVNVFYFQGDISDPQTFVNDLAAVYNTTVVPQLAQQASFETISIKQLDPVKGPEQEFTPAGWPVQGGVFEETSAGLLAALVSFKGALPQYPTNSRKYIWGVSEARVSQNQITDQLFNAVQSFGDAIVSFSSTGGTGNFVCYRRTTGETNPYGSAVARRLVATQRRRSGL